MTQFQQFSVIVNSFNHYFYFSRIVHHIYRASFSNYIELREDTILKSITKVNVALTKNHFNLLIFFVVHSVHWMNFIDCIRTFYQLYPMTRNVNWIERILPYFHLVFFMKKSHITSITFFWLFHENFKNKQYE